jgi:hypothetical protein
VHHTHMRRGMATFATSAALVLVFASGAHAAATVTVTGDDGNPVAVTQGATTAIRQMAPTIGIGFPSSDGNFTATFTGPDSVSVGSAMSCYGYDNWTRRPDFRGNGNYTVTITNYVKSDRSCASPISTETYVYAINSSVAVTPPPGAFLIRAANSFTTNTLSLPVALNPGASTYDVQYALGGVIGSDGAISGPSQAGFVSSTTGRIDLTFRIPGAYTVVARAKNGQYTSPWSPPVTVNAVVPFDLESNPTLPDDRGPSYQIKGIVRDKTLRGKITLAVARGTKGGKYRSIGKTSISSKSTFTKRFTMRRTGTYRLRIHYAGSALAPATTIVGRITFTRRLRFG